MKLCEQREQVNRLLFAVLFTAKSTVISGFYRLREQCEQYIKESFDFKKHIEVYARLTHDWRHLDFFNPNYYVANIVTLVHSRLETLEPLRSMQ